MKLLVFLASLLVIATAQEEEDIFDIVGAMMENGTAELRNILFEHIVEKDGSAFKPLVQTILQVVEPHFCPEDSADQCDVNTSWLLGCNCRRAFADLELECSDAPCQAFECSDAPCQAFTGVKDKGAKALSNFGNANSYEERVRVLVDSLVKPAAELLCDCPGVIGADIECLKNYDGLLFEKFEHLDLSKFQSVVENLDWRALKGLLKIDLDVGCDCIDQFGEIWVAVGAFLDNTFTNREDICLSLIRAEAEYEAFEGSFLGDKDDIGAYVNGIVDAYVTLEHKLACDADCADEIQQTFYNDCCVRRATKRLGAPDVRKKLDKLARSIADIFDYALPESLNLKGVLKKYLSVYDPETLCGEEIDAYRELNEQCDAIEV